LISAPGTKGSRTEALAELLDLYPTLAELCALPRAEGVEGTSLVPVLQNPKASVKEFAITQHPRPAYFDRDSPPSPEVMGYSLRTDRFRYTEWRNWKTGQTDARELYDHQSDPDETQNMVDEPRYAGDVKKSAALLLNLHPIVRPK